MLHVLNSIPEKLDSGRMVCTLGLWTPGRLDSRRLNSRRLDVKTLDGWTIGLWTPGH